MRGVGGVRKSIHQRWLAKALGLGLGLLCLGFKGGQEEIPSEEASTLQIGLVAFPQPPYSPDLAPCDVWLFPNLRGYRYDTIEVIKVAVTKVMPTLTQEDFHVALQKLLERYKNVLQPEEITMKGTRITCV